MKKLFFIVIFVVLVFFLFSNHQKHLTISKKPDFLSEIEEISPNNDLLKIVNAKSERIKSFTTDAKINYKNIPGVSANIKYEKPKNLRVIISSLFGKEMDLGSNANYFWYWVTHPGQNLYYAKHENIQKTRLKNTFDPNWIMECLNVNEIRSDKSVQVGKNIGFFETRTSSTGPIKKLTLVDPERQIIIGHYLFSNNKLIASVEISEFQNQEDFLFPKIMKTVYYEDGISTSWEFKNLKLNPGIDKKTWDMPGIAKKIDIGS